MLKKLKLKFILNNMISIGIVIISTFSALCLMVYVTEELKITETLEDNTKIAIADFEHIPHSSYQPDDFIYDHAFSVLLDDNGVVVAETGTTLDEDTFTNVVTKALESEYSRGKVDSANISYLKKEINIGTIISFVSREHLDTRVNESIAQSSLMALISLLGFLYISKRHADIAVAPVEEAWEQQKQFIADASHDLKTPLTVILANNNILASHQSETIESQMKWIESTSEEASRMSDLINKMLELAKNDAAKEELRFGEVNISETVEHAILQFEVVAFERNIIIESGIQPNIIAKTHRTTFSKVLEILFDNAIKYSDDNSKITVGLIQNSKKIYFTINNKGEHIKPDELPHVFERFYRTNKERVVGGHGLGLSLAKRKCDMLGAKISVESNPEEGTTFTIVLKGKKQ